MEPLSALADLATDRERGASEIAREARETLARLAEVDGEVAAIEQQARRAVLDLLEAHPPMAPLVHLADETLRGLDEQGLTWLSALPRDPPLARRVAEEAASLLAGADTVLTYSRSGTVLAAIEAASSREPLRVLTSEARPGGEGLDVARRLDEAGARVELTYDVALLARVGEADVVLVGADAIATTSFTNKTGTRPLLERASELGTPAHVLASTDKLWPSALPRQPPADLEADWQPPAPGPITVRAPLFERVPLELADAIVTEDGPQEPEALAREAQAVQLHPLVRHAL